VVVLDGRAIGKPADDADARRMLRELRGTRHHVTTGVTVVDAASGRRLTETVTSQVTLRDFTDAEIDASIASGTPLDKAGAYAVQDQVLRPAQSWEGCYSNIVGLPVCRVLEMLEELGCELPAPRSSQPPVDCGSTCPFQGGRKP
jgi:MAF protein